MTTSYCLACGHQGLELILDLGEQKPVNNLGESSAAAPRLPLAMVACPVCGHGQLSKFVPPAMLFDNYLYASSTSNSLRSYEQAFAGAIASIGEGGGSVLEIASNDGLLLGYLKEQGLSFLGVDPAVRMVDRANALGLHTTLGYWPDVVPEIGTRRFDFVVGQNVLPHTPNPLAFLAGARAVLADKGVAIFQTSQVDMVANGEFDTIYHEHCSFFCETSARALGDRAGFRHFGVTYSRIHGNSALFFFSNSAEALKRALAALSSKHSDWDEWRAPLGPNPTLRERRTLSNWRDFGRVARDRMAVVRSITDDARKAGRRVIAVGAAAKGITFVRAAGVTVDLLVDEAEDKIGLVVDGLGIVISGLGDVTYREDDLFLVTAWNFVHELGAKLRDAGASGSSSACTYFPRLTIERLDLA